MKDKIDPQPLKGFRDFPPEKMAIRNAVAQVLEAVFTEFGFQPLATPTLEYKETLLGKYGTEADRLVYTFADQGEREVGLIYDLTVPTARFMSANPNLTKPFKRYQMQRVYRAEKPQKGRYREITQCDVDIFGTTSPLAEAEIIALTATAFMRLGFNNVSLRLNSRAILRQVLLQAQTDDTKAATILQTIDKLDKKPRAEVEQELIDKGLETDGVENLFKALEAAKPDENLQQIMELAVSLGVERSSLQFDPTLVRGLDYYTGAIFEAVVTEPKIGSLAGGPARIATQSVAGGGRYDELIGEMSGQETPAVGLAFGLDRICDVIEELKLPIAITPPPQVLVTLFGEEQANASAKLVQQLRDQGIRAELYLKADKLDKQIKYAVGKNISYLAILGPEEIAQGTVTMKDLKSQEQRKIDLSDLIEILRSKVK